MKFKTKEDSVIKFADITVSRLGKVEDAIWFQIMRVKDQVVVGYTTKQDARFIPKEPTTIRFICEPLNKDGALFLQGDTLYEFVPMQGYEKLPPMKELAIDVCGDCCHTDCECPCHDPREETTETKTKVGGITFINATPDDITGFVEAITDSVDTTVTDSGGLDTGSESASRWYGPFITGPAHLAINEKIAHKVPKCPRFLDAVVVATATAFSTDFEWCGECGDMPFVEMSE